MEPGIYIVGTPIGNLGDISARALAVLKDADVIMAEDTRRAMKLLGRHGIKGELVSCYRFNEASRAKIAVKKALSGAAVALVSNAGMPSVSDPGARLIRECRAAGAPVTVIPGPSAATAALALSGFGGGGFHCEGFLPRKPAARRRRLIELAQERVPVILFESPHRCLKLLAELGEIMPERLVFLARELTKMYEEKLWGTASELQRTLEMRLRPPRAREIKGEITLVVAPCGTRQQSAFEHTEQATENEKKGNAAFQAC